MSEYRLEIAVFEAGGGQFGPKFQVEGDVHCGHENVFLS